MGNQEPFNKWTIIVQGGMISPTPNFQAPGVIKPQKSGVIAIPPVESHRFATLIWHFYNFNSCRPLSRKITFTWKFFAYLSIFAN